MKSKKSINNKSTTNTLSSEEELVDSLKCDELCAVKLKGNSVAQLAEEKSRDRGCKPCFVDDVAY